MTSFSVSALGRLLIAERERWPLWLPVLMAAGTGGYFALRWEPPFWAGPVACAVGLGIVVKAAEGRQTVRLLAICLAVAGIGFSAAQLRTVLVAPVTLEKRHGPATLEGRVARIETLPGQLRVTFDRARIGRLPAPRTPDRVRLRLRGEQPRLQPGDWVRIPAVLMPPPPPSLPGGFDFQRKAFFDGLGAVGYAVGRAEVIQNGTGFGIKEAALAVSALRHGVTERIRQALSDGPTGAVAVALMTGDKAAIPEDKAQAMRDAGLAHLLAISGLHVGLIAGLAFFALRLGLVMVPGAALHLPIKKIAAVGALAAAFAYTQMTGATVPTQRAFVMVGTVLVAVLVDRQGISMRSLAWAAAIVLLLQPESLLGPSFQMSFAAATGLVAVYEGVGRRLYARREGGRSPARRIALYFAAVALTTVVAGLATAPYAVHHFHRLATFGLAANLIAVPITALWIMPWALAAYALMPLGLEAWALIPMGWGVDQVLAVAEGVAGLDGAVVLLSGLPTWGLVAASLGGLWLCLWKGRWRIAGTGGLAVGLVALALTRPPDLLVDGRGNLMAARLPDGRLTLSSLRADSFARAAWMARSGVAEAESWAQFRAGEQDSPLACDALGCVLRHSGWTVALARHGAALDDDCRAADIVISREPVRGVCPSARLVIDRFDLWRGGAHGVWLDGDGPPRIESVNGRRGDRPWVARPGGST